MADEWRPTASPRARRARAALLRFLRAFLNERDVLEVEVPLVGRHPAADPNIRQFEVRGAGRGWLRSSPEYPLKRLLAAGVGDVYQLSRAFRDGEAGPRHNPEFTLLEWYRLGFDDRALAAEVLTLIEGAAQVVDGARRPAGARWVRYSELRAAAIDHFAGESSLEDDADARRARALAACGASPEWSADAQESWLIACATDHLPDDALTVVTHFPADQAVLARLDPDDARWARRFEVFWGPLELANGYWELSDADELERRFRAEASRRGWVPANAPHGFDPALTAALRAGLPDCAGVALGVDRLLMALLDAQDIAEVLEFPWPRA